MSNANYTVGSVQFAPHDHKFKPSKATDPDDIAEFYRPYEFQHAQDILKALGHLSNTEAATLAGQIIEQSKKPG